MYTTTQLLEETLKTSDILTGFGLAVCVVGLVAQLNAPNCPTCGTKLVVINNYCTNCKIHWRQQ